MDAGNHSFACCTLAMGIFPHPRDLVNLRRWRPLAAARRFHWQAWGWLRRYTLLGSCVRLRLSTRQLSAPQRQGGQFTWLRRRCGRRVSFTTL